MSGQVDDTICGLVMALESVLPAACDAFVFGLLIHSNSTPEFREATSRQLARNIAFARAMLAKAKGEPLPA